LKNDRQSYLIEAAELASRCAAGDVVVVDCRFDLLRPEAGLATYLEGHIPGARYADLDKVLARRPSRNEGRHPLPTPTEFAQRLGQWGISRDTPVVVYDAQSGAIAARLWWMLRWIGHENVRMLNGGLSAWMSDDLELSPGPVNVTPAVYEVRNVHDEWVVTTDELEGSLSDEAQLSICLLDARSEVRFQGLKEPIDPVAGHIPGALSLPFDFSLAEDARYLSDTEIRETLEKRVPRALSEPVTAMCGSGVTACHLILALELAGIHDARLYTGSWSEWIRDNERPVVTGL